MLEPQFFLASVSDGWRPAAVPVYSASELVGIFYARERVLSGIPTGVVYGDDSLGALLLAKNSHAAHVFRTGVQALLSSPKIHSLRLRLASSTQSYAVRQLANSRPVKAQYSEMKDGESRVWKDHVRLPLPDTYDEFLNVLGSTTRHNFRYYRRRSDAAGHKFIDHLSLDELRSASFDLIDKSKLEVAWRKAEIENGLRMVAATTHPLAIGLKHPNGEWMSVLAGWYRPGGAVLCFQCNNDTDFGRDSLSVVLRGYLIESLIRQGLHDLVIWAGTAPPLSRYVTQIPTINIRIDVPSYRWRVARWILSNAGPYLPRRFAAAARWIA